MKLICFLLPVIFRDFASPFDSGLLLVFLRQDVMHLMPQTYHVAKDDLKL